MIDPSPLAIAAEGLFFAYPECIQAIDDVTLRIGAGELVALVGANGSGKTTLMKLLLRLLKPQSGEIRVHGRGIAKLASAELYREIGMVFQNPADQLFAPTVGEDVAFGPRNLGLDEAEVSAHVEQALAAVDAVHLRGRPIHHLSFGEQKRVCLAGVLAMDPKILVLDEPTAGLDPAGEAHMIELLLRLNRERGITVLVSTHAVDLLPVMANRICVLKQGAIFREGTPHEVFEDRQAIVSAGLRLPLMAQLFHELSDAGWTGGRLPLSVAEARLEIERWMQSRSAAEVLP